MVRRYVFIHYLSFVLVMAVIANYVLYWETFLRMWISFLFHVSTSSYERRARCITLETETEMFHVHTYLRTVITSEWKEMKKFSFFIRSVARILTGQGRLTKRGHKLLQRPHNGVQLEKVLKIVFENVSKVDFIIVISGDLKDIGCSLNPKHWEIRA